MWACKVDEDSVNINSVRKWLGVHDSTVRTVLNDRAAARSRRHEYTCEWFQRALLDFTRGDGDILAITGPSGCGKSMLASWVTERLQRPLGKKKTHETMFLTIGMLQPHNLPSKETFGDRFPSRWQYHPFPFPQ
jgi:ABC-type polysaccharide/polyol phosphate transport system ATPase subunit